MPINNPARQPDFAQSLYDPGVDETLIVNATAPFDTDPLIIDSGRLVAVPSNSILWTDAPRYPAGLYANAYGRIVHDEGGAPRPLTAPFINVLDYGAHADDGVTDNAAPFQAAIAAAGVGGTIYVPAATGHYRFLSGLDLSSKQSILILGECPANAGTGNRSIIDFRATSGSAAVFNCQNAFGVQFKNLLITVAAATGWAGRIFDFRNVSGVDTAYCLVEDCVVGGGTLALSCVDMDKAIEITLNRCVLSGATNSIVGKSVQGNYSNSIQILNTRFANGNTSYIKNPGQNWLITGCTFEPRATGLIGSITQGAGVTCNSCTIIGNWFGDVGGSGIHVSLGGNGISLINNYMGGSASTTALQINASSSAGITVIGNEFVTHSIAIDFGVTTLHTAVTILSNAYTAVTTNLGGTLPTAAIYQDPVNGNTFGPGSTTVAPLKLTSGTNLTAAAAGVVEYDGTAFYTTNDTTNGRRFNDNWSYFRLTGSGAGITTIADFFGTNDGIPLVASGVYEIEWHCYFSQATAGTATWTIVTATTALANLTGEYIGSPVGGIGTVGTPQTAAINATSSTSTAFPVTGTEATAVTHYFTVRVLATAGAGTSNTRLRLTMSAGTATPLINSYFRVRRLAGANVGTYVA